MAISFLSRPKPYLINHKIKTGTTSELIFIVDGPKGYQ